MCRVLMVLSVLPSVVVGQGKRFACSYAHPEAMEIGYRPEHVTLDVCTHVIFKGFSFPRFVGRRLVFSDDDQKAFTSLLTGVRGRSNSTRVVASIGGTSVEFALIAASNVHRRTFVQAAGALLVELDADAIELGFDLDEWNDGKARIGTDRLSMVTLLRDLRQTVTATSNGTERRNRELWIRGAVRPNVISTAYNVFEVCGLVDQVTLDTVYLPRGASHAPIHSKPFFLPNIPGIEPTVDPSDGIVDGTHAWIREGCPPKKLMLGVGLLAVGKTYMSFLDQFFSGLGQDFFDWGPVNRNVVAYRELCKALEQPGWSFGWEPYGLMPYAKRKLSNGEEERYSYENEESLGHKIELIVQNRLGGVYVDFLHADDIDGSCGEAYALTRFLSSRLQAIPSEIGFAIDWN